LRLVVGRVRAVGHAARELPVGRPGYGTSANEQTYRPWSNNAGVDLGRGLVGECSRGARRDLPAFLSLSARGGWAWRGGGCSGLGSTPSVERCSGHARLRQAAAVVPGGNKVPRCFHGMLPFGCRAAAEESPGSREFFLDLDDRFRLGGAWPSAAGCHDASPFVLAIKGASGEAFAATLGLQTGQRPIVALLPPSVRCETSTGLTRSTAPSWRTRSSDQLAEYAKLYSAVKLVARLPVRLGPGSAVRCLPPASQTRGRRRWPRNSSRATPSSPFRRHRPSVP